MQRSSAHTLLTVHSDASFVGYNKVLHLITLVLSLRMRKNKALQGVSMQI